MNTNKIDLLFPEYGVAIQDQRCHLVDSQLLIVTLVRSGNWYQIEIPNISRLYIWFPFGLFQVL